MNVPVLHALLMHPRARAITDQLSADGGSPDFRGPSEGGGGQASVPRVPSTSKASPDPTITPPCQQLSDSGQLRESPNGSPHSFLCFTYLFGFVSLESQHIGPCCIVRDLSPRSTGPAG